MDGSQSTRNRLNPLLRFYIYCPELKLKEEQEEEKGGKYIQEYAAR